MKLRKIQLIFLMIALLQSSIMYSACAQVTKVPNGILVKVKGSQVGLFTANNTTFCLSLNDTVAPGIIKSVFIEDNHAATPFTVISALPSYGIKTSYGKLVINTEKGSWSLYDAAGRELISDGSYSTNGNSVQIAYTAKGLLYGSGNKSTKALEKEQSAAASGNGVTDVPYYWNSAGYSALGVSVNDDQPGSWKRGDDKTGLTWKFSGKAANLYLWPAKTLYNAANSYIKLTGRPKLPPRWAFGYLQSQWGWKDSAYIADVAAKFRAHQLPVDAFIIDFEWYTPFPDYFMKKEGSDGFNDFGFNPKLFPHPAKQLAELKSQGIKFIGIRKPRLGNKLFLDTVRKNGWLKSPDNPDADRDLNYSNPGLRQWYGQKLRPLINAGVDAWWNDEGESYYTCYYGWNTAERDLLATACPNMRHFALNRAFSPGNQRFGYCTWTGDILSTWESLNKVPKDLLNFSLSGMYYGACDIGGFSGSHDSPVTKEMLVRWFQAGVFFPVMRSHSNVETTPHFPYLWGEDGEAAMRKALDLRYQLLPYLYSLGHEAYSTGAPIMRPLLMEFSTDTTIANMTNEWLEGKGVLTAPVLNEGGKRSVYLPKDTWYDFNTGAVLKGPLTFTVNEKLDETPIYVRAGTILPLGPVIQYSEQRSDNPLEIRIYPGKNGSFNLVEDDGVSYNYLKGDTKTTAFTWNDKTKTLTWKVSGPYTGKNTYKMIKVVLGKQEKTLALNKTGRVVFK
jgi:alpha-glucosidase